MKRSKDLMWIGLVALILVVVSCSKSETNSKESSKNTANQSGSIDSVFVEGGTFNRGEYTVTVSSFQISKYEITQAQYKKIMKKNPSSDSRSGDLRLPVEEVSWYDAVAFCNALSISEKLDPCYIGSGETMACYLFKNGWRLPTEAEWVWAAIGGKSSKDYRYSGSNEAKLVAQYIGSGTAPVGSKQANELGIYDMSGNVWEWCWDWQASYPSNNVTDPTGGDREKIRSMGGTPRRVIMGGCWNSGADDIMIYTGNNRGYEPSIGETRNGVAGEIGFRVVRRP